MLLATLERRIRNPKEFEKEFEKFWIGIDAKISQEKSVAQVSRYDGRAIVLGVNRFFETGPVAFNTNMNNFTPPETEHLLITRLRLYEGILATVNLTVWAAPSTDLILNSQISVLNNGVRVLSRYPGLDFQALTTRDNATLELEEPIAWIGQTDLIVEVITPTGLDVPLNTNFRVEVIGIGYTA